MICLKIRVFVFFLCTLLLISAYAVSEVRTDVLLEMDGVQTFEDDNGIDTVIRPAGQPYEGTVEREDTQLLAFLDYVETPDEGDLVYIRLTLALETWEQLSADSISLECGKQRYVFDLMPRISEYDGTYYEDYMIFLTDTSLPMLKAMAGSRQDDWSVVFHTGEETVKAQVHIPHGDIRSIYNSYTDAKGLKQDFEPWREFHPVRVEKAKK